jgi:hypothetical protein
MDDVKLRTTTILRRADNSGRRPTGKGWRSFESGNERHASQQQIPGPPHSREISIRCVCTSGSVCASQLSEQALRISLLSARA